MKFGEHGEIPKIPAALALVLSLFVTAICQGQARLEQRLSHTVYVDVKHDSSQDFSFEGHSKRAKTKIHFVFKLHPFKSDADSTVLEGTVINADASSIDNGNTPDEEIWKTMAALKDQKFLVTITKGNQAIEVAPSDDMVEAFGGDGYRNADETKKHALANTVQDVLMVHLIDAFVPSPGADVRAADNWHNTAIIDSTQGFTHMEIDRKYARSGSHIFDGQRVESIDWTSKVKLEPLPDAVFGDGVALEKLEPKSETLNEGTVLWDPAAKRPARIDCRQSYDIVMTLKDHGESHDVKGKGTDNLVLTFSSEKPDDTAGK